jgi:hypothetical protein
MYSDLFSVYPTDNYVNNQRGSDPYGEVDAPTWTSLNGSKRGTCSYPGYAGPAFEPIDAYKGDLARSYFYMTTRYYTEDAGWPGSAMTSGADLMPWAISMLLEWHYEDPVSRKEIERNGTIYWMQFNRNPFVDRPEFAGAMFAATGIDDVVAVPFRLLQNAPNPFNPTTTIAFSLLEDSDVELAVYDVAGRLVVNLVSDELPAGAHSASWDGRDASGRELSSGVYFYSLGVEGAVETRKMVLLK